MGTISLLPHERIGPALLSRWSTICQAPPFRRQPTFWNRGSRPARP